MKVRISERMKYYGTETYELGFLHGRRLLLSAEIHSWDDDQGDGGLRVHLYISQLSKYELGAEDKVRRLSEAKQPSNIHTCTSLYAL